MDVQLHGCTARGTLLIYLVDLYSIYFCTDLLYDVNFADIILVMISLMIVMCLIAAHYFVNDFRNC